ncbi:MAG TPA: glycosyltransferase family A protein [Rhodothermales bacterium]|nr:glycosyltransferase family A protein [Rhodothermales bacterium]
MLTFEMRRPSVSVLTPTHQRARYLHRVWQALAVQVCKDFEWIVADDGSTDGTEAIVRSLAEQSDFPVVFIRADVHIGKIHMDNEAIAAARGDFIIWCDSDDYFVPHTIQRLLDCWGSIPAEQRHSYVGVTALCTTNTGILTNPFSDGQSRDVSWNDLAEVHHVTADMLFFACADALKKHPFPEVDLVIPESVVWSAIGHQQSRFIPEVLQVKEYQYDAGLSFSGRMAYNRGRAHALAATVRNFRNYPRSWRVRTWRLVTFIRYCTHGELSILEAFRLWRGNSGALAFWLAVPAGKLLAAADALQGKVDKTHREFLSAKDKVEIRLERLNEVRFEHESVDR